MCAAVDVRVDVRFIDRRTDIDVTAGALGC
jgi:hypothetical protein